MGASKVVRAWRVAGLAVLLLAASAIGPLAWGRLQDAFAATGGAKPVVVPITPFRLVDTRPAADDPVLGGPDEPIGQGETRTYQAAGVQSVPADAVGVVLNITALSASAPSFLTVFPAGSGVPATSTLNPAPGSTVFNSATVLLGAGKFSVFHNAGTVHVIIDVVGYLQDHNHDDRYLEQDQPIIVTESVRSWTTIPALGGPAPTTFSELGPFVGVSSNNFIWSSVTAPTSVGGTSYRLASVEYCIEQIGAGAQVNRVILGSNVSLVTLSPASAPDVAIRTTTGCHSVSPNEGGTARSYGILLRFGGDATKTVVIGAVRSTWVPVGSAPSEVTEPGDGSFFGD